MKILREMVLERLRRRSPRPDPGPAQDAGPQALVEATRRELAVFAADMMGAQAYLGQFELLRGQRRLLRDLVDASEEGYMLIDPRPGLRIVDISPGYAAATMVDSRRTAGEKLFDIFPDNPGMAGAGGVSNLFESLQRAGQSGRVHAMAVQRYDVRDAAGAFVERHWRPSNTPIFDEAGRLIYLLHHATEVAPEDRNRAFELI